MAKVFSESAFTQLRLMWGGVLFWHSVQSESANYSWEDGSFWNGLFILETFSSNTLRGFVTEQCFVMCFSQQKNQVFFHKKWYSKIQHIAKRNFWSSPSSSSQGWTCRNLKELLIYVFWYINSWFILFANSQYSQMHEGTYEVTRFQSSHFTSMEKTFSWSSLPEAKQLVISRDRVRRQTCYSVKSVCSSGVTSFQCCFVCECCYIKNICTR